MRKPSDLWIVPNRACPDGHGQQDLPPPDHIPGYGRRLDNEDSSVPRCYVPDRIGRIFSLAKRKH